MELTQFFSEHGYCGISYYVNCKANVKCKLEETLPVLTQYVGHDFSIMKYKQHQCNYDICNVLWLVFISLGYIMQICKWVLSRFDRDCVLLIIIIIAIIIVIIIIIFSLYNYQNTLDAWDSCKVVSLNLLQKFCYPFTYFSI